MNLFHKKKGCSSSDDRIYLLQKFINTFGVSKIEVILGDREFLGQKWIKFLQDHSIPFVMRLRENQQTVYCHQRKRLVLLSEMANSLKKGETRCFGEKIFSTKNSPYTGCLTIKKNRNSKIIGVIHSHSVKNPINLYKARWSIEVAFKNLKSNGFHLEDTSITCPKRLENLINIVLIAFTFCVNKGLSFEDICEVSILEETSQIPIKQSKEFFLRESFFHQGLSDLTYSLIYKRRKTIKKICLLFSQTFHVLHREKLFFNKNSSFSLGN